MKQYSDLLFDGLACLGTAVQFESVELWLKIISLVLTIFSVIASLVIKIIMWKQKATKDGKIDTEELKELKNIVDESKDELKGVNENERNTNRSK